MNLMASDLSAGARAVPPPALSNTHSQIFSAVAGELLRRSPGVARPSLLDAGCGDGHLLAYLVRAMPGALGRPVDVHGFDIAGHGTQDPAFFDACRRHLAEADPGTDWADRLRLIGEPDAWPYPDASFDAVVSNQVIEHVADIDHFLGQLARVLRPGGASVHVFPSLHCIVDPHVHTPFAHRMRDIDLSRRWLTFWAGLRPKIYRSWRAGRPTRADLEEYARAHADYLQRFTHYRSLRQIREAVKRAGLACSFSETPRYYGCFLRKLAGRPPVGPYAAPSPVSGAFATFLLRYVSNVTLTISRDEFYRR